MTIATVTVSSTRTRTSAGCRTCPWTSDPQLSDLSVRVVARAHAGRTGHCVAVLASTVTLLTTSTAQAIPADPAEPAVA